MFCLRASTGLSTLSLLPLLACGGDKVEPEPLDTGDGSTSDSSPYEPSSTAGCRYEESWDEESDGTAQWWTVKTWDPRVDDDGDVYLTGETYENELGETTSEASTYDDQLCQLSYLYEEVFEGGGYGWRTRSVCDEQGQPISADHDSWDGEAWLDYGTVALTNTYDEAGHLTAVITVISYADGVSPDETQRSAYTYDGDLVVQIDRYVGAGDEEQSYYTLEVEYGDDDLPDVTRLWLGAYFGRSEGELYSVTEATYDADGHILTYDYRGVYAGEDSHKAWSWDEHGRPLSEEAWSDSEGTHSLTTVTWDEAAYRYATYAYADLVDSTQDYVQTYTYDGPWPWAGTGARDYADERMLDGTYTFAYTCD